MDTNVKENPELPKSRVSYFVDGKLVGTLSPEHYRELKERWRQWVFEEIKTAIASQKNLYAMSIGIGLNRMKDDPDGLVRFLHDCIDTNRSSMENVVGVVLTEKIMLC